MLRTGIIVIVSSALLGSGIVTAAPTVPESFAAPASPESVSASIAGDGVRVNWNHGTSANPPVTYFVVHGGPGSCPVIVDARKSTVVVPVASDQKVFTPVVQAVNDYGFSDEALASSQLDVRRIADPDVRGVQLLEFSDFHGAIQGSESNAGAARLATAFQRDRKAVQPTFTVSAGDNIGGAPVISTTFNEVPTIKALNLMKLDVSTLGNHEHDRPLTHLRSMLDLSTFRWVASNYDTLTPLQGKKNGVEPYVIIKRDGVSVGFVGMNTEDTLEVVPAENLAYGIQGRKSLNIEASARPVQRQIDAAKRAGADFVVALLHQGWQENKGGVAEGRLIELAGALTGAAVIYGGHTHQQFASVIGGSSVVEVPNSGQVYSRTTVCVNTQTDRVWGSHPSFVTTKQLAGLTPDPRTAALVARYQTLLGDRLDQVVGSMDKVLPRGGNPPLERSGESALGDLIAEAIRTRYQTQLVFITGGGIRDSLPAATYIPKNTSLRRPTNSNSGPFDITLGDLQSVMPFDINVAVTEISGEQLWVALENGVSDYPGSGRFPQISGFRFRFDPDQPVGSRILEVTLEDGTPIARDGRIFTVSTIDYIVNGGDGYAGVFNPTRAVIRDPWRDSVIQLFERDRDAGIVTKGPSLDGRISR